MSRPKKVRPLPTLKGFDYKLVQAGLDGLLINVDRDLRKRAEQGARTNNLTSARYLTMLNVMVRFAINSYRAVCYVMAETPEDPKRKQEYALILPPVNRQLLDLLFSLVYILDDFEKRSSKYQRAGWRELKQEYQKFKTEYARAPEWQPFFSSFKEDLKQRALLYQITDKQQNDPSDIPYWKHPGELKDEPSRSRPFLRWLDKWLYGDTSAQAHLSFGGLIMMSHFLVADMLGGQQQQIVEEYMIHQFRFQQFSRTALVVLAIATEVSQYCKLQNDAQIAYLWHMFTEHVPEGKDMFKKRYEALLQK